MKAITVKEPFASLISEGIKKYEFRTWKTNYRGEVYIHAGKGINKEYIYLLKRYNINKHNSEIIAKAQLTDCIKVNNDFKEFLRKENYEVYKMIIEDDDFNGYAFKLENVKKIKPISINGKLSIWNFEKK